MLNAGKIFLRCDGAVYICKCIPFHRAVERTREKRKGSLLKRGNEISRKCWGIIKRDCEIWSLWRTSDGWKMYIERKGRLGSSNALMWKSATLPTNRSSDIVAIQTFLHSRLLWGALQSVNAALLPLNCGPSRLRSYLLMDDVMTLMTKRHWILKSDEFPSDESYPSSTLSTYNCTCILH